RPRAQTERLSLVPVAVLPARLCLSARRAAPTLQRAPRPPGGSQQVGVRRFYRRNTKIGGEGSCSEQPCLAARPLDVRADPPAEAGGSAKSICAIRAAPARRLRAPQEPGGVAAVGGTRNAAYIRASTAGSAASESDRSRSRRGQPWCAPDSR